MAEEEEEVPKDEEEEEEKNSSDEDEGEDEEGGAPKAPSSKVKIVAIGPDDQCRKLKVRRQGTLADLRKRIGRELRIPVEKLELEIKGELLLQARTLPFRTYDVTEPIRWFKADRLPRLLSSKGLKNINARSKWGRSILHYTSLDRDETMMEQVLKHHLFDIRLINARDGYGDTALMLSSIQGDVDMVEMLLDKGAETEHQNIYGRTALMLASEHGFHTVVTALLRSHALLPKPKTTRSKATTKASAKSLVKLNGRVKAHESIGNWLKEEAAFNGDGAFGGEEEVQPPPDP